MIFHPKINSPPHRRLRNEQPKYEKPSFLADVGAGMDDVFSGIKQGALYLKDGITGGNDYEKFTKEKADEKALYEKARTESGAGINFGRFVGQTIASSLAISTNFLFLIASIPMSVKPD